MFTLKKEIVDSMDEFLESQDTPDPYVESSKLIDEKVASFRASLPDDKQLEFIKNAVTLISEHRDELDNIIEKYSEGWKSSRISKTAMACMRCAICEILYMDDIPQKVSVNEAVEIAKKYDEAEVVSFINGILGSFLKELNGAPQ